MGSNIDSISTIPYLKIKKVGVPTTSTPTPAIDCKITKRNKIK